MSDIINRIRFVDVEKLTDEQLEVVREQLGSKVREIEDEACEKANKFLSVYGLEVKMKIVIQEKP